MERICIPVNAYKLNLLPMHSTIVSGGRRSEPRGQRLQALENGLAIPSFWSSTEINEAFRVANSIWTREADIEFTPVTIFEQTMRVPSDEHRMWIHFLNNIRHPRGGLGAAFVNELPSSEGGWGGGHIAIVAGQHLGNALPTYAGTVLAHEFGHALTNNPGHVSEPSNLMYHRMNPRVASAGLLNPAQVRQCRTRAERL